MMIRYGCHVAFLILALLAAVDHSTSTCVALGPSEGAIDPARQAIEPLPASGDQHVDADADKIHLRWQAPPQAVKYEVYFARSESAEQARQAIAEAVPGMPSHVGTVSGKRASVFIAPTRTLLHYAWRVDAIDAEGRVTRGEAWEFRPRHLAFPGAKGEGRFAIGGRGGRVLKVTNLNDSGPGSLRAAVETDAPRTIVFDVGGAIDLKSKLVVRHPYLTIAGQTAPGKGICLVNHSLEALNTHDVIVRYLHVRLMGDAEESFAGISTGSSEHTIVDHCSVNPQVMDHVRGDERRIEFPEVHRGADWDSDDDGIPNEWEEYHGLNPHSPTEDLSDIHSDRDRDGYTNLEDYLFSVVAEMNANRRIDREAADAALQSPAVDENDGISAGK